MKEDVATKVAKGMMFPNEWPDFQKTFATECIQILFDKVSSPTKDQIELVTKLVNTFIEVSLSNNVSSALYKTNIIILLEEVNVDISQGVAKDLFLKWKDSYCKDIVNFNLLITDIADKLVAYWSIETNGKNKSLQEAIELALVLSNKSDDVVPITQLDLLSKFINDGSNNSNRSKAWTTYRDALEVMISNLHTSKFADEEIISLLSLTEETLSYTKLRLCLANPK